MWERPPDPRPGLEEFAGTPEPGEERRNFFDRCFVYYRWRWLLDGRGMFTGGRSDELLTVGASGTVLAGEGPELSRIHFTRSTSMSDTAHLTFAGDLELGEVLGKTLH